MDIASVDVAKIMHFTIPPVELFLRGTVMFWFLLLIFRFVLRRDVGSSSISDFLFVVILGDAAQNAMIGSGTSVADGAALIGTLVFWNYSIDSLSYYFPTVERLMSVRKLCLIRNGNLQRRNMRREFITVEEVNEKIREAGLNNKNQIKYMYMESDGEISILKQKNEGD